MMNGNSKAVSGSVIAVFEEVANTSLCAFIAGKKSLKNCPCSYVLLSILMLCLIAEGAAFFERQKLVD